MNMTHFKSIHRNALALAISATCLSGAWAEEDLDLLLEEVVVTGSYIKGSAGDDALPVLLLDSDYIDSIGATTVADVIGKLTISSGAENQADSFTQGATQGTTNVNMRGWGLSSTLV
jgi:iron complex outermembrane receptor protein